MLLKASKRLIILTLALISLAVTPTAQGTEPELRTLDDNATLEDYLAYAALNNPGLEATFNEWQAAMERVPQSRSLPNPRLTYRYYIREVETRVGPQRQSFGISQSLPWFGKLGSRGEVASEAAEAARQRYETAKLKLFYRVKKAYWEYYYLGRAIVTVRENRDLAQYLEEVVRKRYTAAVAGHPDVIRAQVELGKLDDRLRTLESLRGPLAADLAAALNRPTRVDLPWPTSAPYEPVETADDEILGWLAESSPELKALEHEIAGRREAIDLARKDYFPEVTLGLDYIDTDDALVAGTPDSGKDPVVAMATIELPIWLSRNKASVREARARHWAAVNTLTERENTLDAQASMVLYHLRDAERKVDLYGNALLPKAKESLKATEASFRAGKASFTDLVDAQRILLEFELSYERALTDHAQRLAELEMLVGRTLPRANPSSAGGIISETAEDSLGGGIE